MPTILVTGATGFLGRALVESLQDAGINVRATGRSNGTGLDCDYRVVDLSMDGNYPKDLLEDIDVVVHVAGLAHQFGAQQATAEDYHRVNTQCTQRLLNDAIAAGVSHFVLISSVAVYGNPGIPSCDETYIGEPSTPYAISKLNAERICEQAAAEHPIATTCLRMSTIYGAGDPGNMARLLRMLLSKKSFWQIGQGVNRKSLIHIQDAAEACLRAAIMDRRAGEFHVYNIADEPHLMADVVSTACELTGTKIRPFPLPPKALILAGRGLNAVCFGKGPFGRLATTIEKWITHDAYDGQEFCQDHDFQPSVSLRDGLKSEVDWLRTRPSARDMGHTAKRAFDMVVSGILLLLFSPIMLVVALAVRCTSKGPAIYIANRVGRNNRIFRMLKFRTMRTDTPQVATHLLKDSRSWMTPIGDFLRKSSLDELPQLWNVFRGDMSLVGPRPALYNEDDLNSLRTFRGVHQMLPGITGWAQVSGRDEIAREAKVEFDVAYMKQQSLLFDLQILWRTLFKVVKRDGIRQADDGQCSKDLALTVRQGEDLCVITRPQHLTLVAFAAEILEQQGTSSTIICQQAGPIDFPATSTTRTVVVGNNVQEDSLHVEVTAIEFENPQFEKNARALCRQLSSGTNSVSQTSIAEVSA